MAHSYRTHSFTGVESPVDVTIRTAGTDVTLTHGALPGTIEVQLEADADNVDLDAAQVSYGDGLIVDIPALLAPDGPGGFALQFGSHTIQLGGGGLRTRVEVSVPAASRVTVTTKGGDVTIGAPCDELRVESGSGDVEVREGAATAHLRTGSGEITVASAGSLSASTGAGDIDVDTAGTAALKSGSGDITVASVEGRLDAQTASGDIDVRDAGGDVSVKTASGDATVAGIRRGKVHASTASGDLSLSFAAGVPVWTDATTVSGDIDNALSARGEPRDGQDFVEVVARTVSGDLTLTDA